MHFSTMYADTVAQNRYPIFDTLPKTFEIALYKPFVNSGIVCRACASCVYVWLVGAPATCKEIPGRL